MSETWQLQSENRRRRAVRRFDGDFLSSEAIAEGHCILSKLLYDACVKEVKARDGRNVDQKKQGY